MLWFIQYEATGDMLYFKGLINNFFFSQVTFKSDLSTAEVHDENIKGPLKVRLDCILYYLFLKLPSNGISLD